MGVENVTLKTCFDFYHEDEITRLWGRLFTCTYDGEFKLDPEEVESGQFMTIQVMALHTRPLQISLAHHVYIHLLYTPTHSFVLCMCQKLCMCLGHEPLKFGVTRA